MWKNKSQKEKQQQKNSVVKKLKDTLEQGSNILELTGGKKKDRKWWKRLPGPGVRQSNQKKTVIGHGAHQNRWAH